MSGNLIPSVQVPFRPTSVEEYLALQLAKRLGDELKVGFYLRYVDHHPAVHLAKLFHQAKLESDSANAFHSLLN